MVTSKELVQSKEPRKEKELITLFNSLSLTISLHCTKSNLSGGVGASFRKPFTHRPYSYSNFMVDTYITQPQISHSAV